MQRQCRELRRSLRKTTVLTASVVYRQVFTHNSYGYSSSVRLIADCERLTTEEHHSLIKLTPTGMASCYNERVWVFAPRFLEGKSEELNIFKN